MVKNLSKVFVFILISTISINAKSQSIEESLDYINTKQEIYKHINNYGDLFKYLVDIQNIDGINHLVVVDFQAISEVTIKKARYSTNIKNITAIEYNTDEIGRLQIKIFAKHPGFLRLDFLDSQVADSYDRVIEIVFSKNTNIEQVKSLIKAYKHLVKLLGGADLSVDKF
jgi:hypothetical protein